jgi:hypothetical protein
VIRPATEADAALVQELWRAFGVEGDVHPDVSLLADEDGIVSLRRNGVVDVLYVRPKARSQGIGKELLRAAAEWARLQGADDLELVVPESGADSVHMYERLGFRTVQRLLSASVDALLQPEDGPTFGAVHVQTDDVDKVHRDAVKFLREEPEIEPVGGWIRVRSDGTDADAERLTALAKELSYTSASVALSLGVERGAVVRYNLFDRGADVDEYLSVPEFYGELPPGDVYALGANATLVARLTGADAHRVREVARTAATPGELPPAQELYEQIAELMGVKA